MANIKKRRAFLRDLGVGTAAAFLQPLTASGRQAVAPDRSENPKTAKRKSLVLSNGIKLEMLADGKVFKGLGEISVNKTILRSGESPMFCEIRNPKGVSVTACYLKDQHISPERLTLTFSTEVLAGGQMEYMLHTVRNRENLYGWVNGSRHDEQTLVTLEILPITRKIGKYSALGFSYQYKFSSKNFDIYKILDRSTWESGGKALGNECWMRIGHAPGIRKIENPDQYYTTELYMKGLANPNIFQFLPLQTELQGFTFTANEAGVLVSYAQNPSHIRSLIEKPRDKNELFHFHQHCNDLSENFETSPMEVLWIAEKNSSQTDRHNIYEAVRSSVSRNLHQQAELKEENIVSYGEIEEWLEPDFDRYTDVILPQFIKSGVKRVFIPNEFQNAMNTWGLSNMCCNVDYKFSETAGPEKIKRFCKAANDAGVQVEMWGNTAISTLTVMTTNKNGKQKGIDFLPEKGSIGEVLKAAREPFVRNLSNAIEADHYSPLFAVLNLRDKDIFDYWLKSWKTAHEAGISSIFLDSSFNMTSDKFHFIQNTEKSDAAATNNEDKHRLERPATEPRSAILTQFTAHLTMVKNMQEMGYAYCGEDLGVFGVHRHGPDMEKILDSLPIWRDCVMTFDEKKIPAHMSPLETYFRGLAYRITWCMRWDFKKNRLDSGISDPSSLNFIRIFNEVIPYMRRREILNEEGLVKYSSDDDKTLIFWAVKPSTLNLGRRHKIKNLTKNIHYESEVLTAASMEVFMLDNAV